MSRYDGLIIPRSYSEYINKTDAATLLQALQLSGVMDNAPTANSVHPVKSGGIKTTIDNAVDAVETSLKPVDTVASGNMQSVTSNAVAEKFIHNLVDDFFTDSLTASAFPQTVYRRQFPKGLYAVSVSFFINAPSGFDFCSVHINQNYWAQKDNFLGAWIQMMDFVELTQDSDITVELNGHFKTQNDSYTITQSNIKVCCLKKL